MCLQDGMTYIGREDANFNPDIGRECLEIIVKALVLRGFRWSIFKLALLTLKKLTCMADVLF